MIKNEFYFLYVRWMTVIPLGFFLIFYMIKEAILDLRRIKNDKASNDNVFDKKCIVDRVFM